jgi:hypothetical protein
MSSVTSLGFVQAGAAVLPSDMAGLCSNPKSIGRHELEGLVYADVWSMMARWKIALSVGERKDAKWGFK